MTRNDGLCVCRLKNGLGGRCMMPCGRVWAPGVYLADTPASRPADVRDGCVILLCAGSRPLRMGLMCHYWV